MIYVLRFTSWPHYIGTKLEIILLWQVASHVDDEEIHTTGIHEELKWFQPSLWLLSVPAPYSRRVVCSQRDILLINVFVEHGIIVSFTLLKQYSQFLSFYSNVRTLGSTALSYPFKLLLLWDALRLDITWSNTSLRNYILIMFLTILLSRQYWNVIIP